MCGHPEDAEEVTQETMLAAARNLDRFRGQSAFSSWLYAIARSFCSRQRRRGAGRFEVEPLSREVLERPAEEADPERRALQREQSQLVREALDALSPAHREVIVLRDLEGLTAPEAAEALGIPVPALKSRLHRARRALRRELLRRLEGSERVPERSERPECPDVLDLYSRYLEGEIGQELCQHLERHLQACPTCKELCDSLKRVLHLCRSVPQPEAPSELAERLRRELRRWVPSPQHERVLEPPDVS